MSSCRAQRRVLTQTATIIAKILTTRKVSSYQDRFSESHLKKNTRKRSKFIVLSVLESTVSKSVQTRATANLSSSTISGRTLQNLRTSSKLGRTTRYSKVKTKTTRGFSNGETRIHKTRGSTTKSSSEAKVTNKILFNSRFLSMLSTNRGMSTRVSLSCLIQPNKSHLITRLGVK